MSALVWGLCAGVAIVGPLLAALGWAELRQYGEPDQ